MATLTTTATAVIESIDEHGSSVRFDTQCVVIPEPAPRPRMPRVVTKSYSLPLWKRRAASQTGSSGSVESESFSPEENHVVLRVPLPSFSTKPQSPTRSTDQSVLTPCLVHRSPSIGSSVPGSPPLTRRTPRKTSLSPSRSDVVTVPLRPCCAACQASTEAALVDGEAWTERFSHAAHRRRSLSADGGLRTLTVAGSAAAASLGALGHGTPISVDEVDKRRRLSDTARSSRKTQETVWLNDSVDGSHRLPSLLHSCRPGVLASSPDSRPPPSPTRITPSTPRIPEEEDDDDDDEDQLFPLPSPRRTPASSPAPSPTASLSSLTVGLVQQKSTSSPSPSNCSVDSAGLPTKNRFLAPPTGASSSSLSLPKTSESTTDLNEDPPRAPSPNMLGTLPSISGRPRTRSPSPRISRTPPSPPTDTKPSTSGIPQSPPPATKPARASPIPIPIPSPRSRSPNAVSSSPQHSPTRSRFPGRSTRSHDPPKTASPPPSFSPSTSPNLSASPNAKRTRGSFSMASPRGIIADMLRGVGAMGSGGSGGLGVHM
ncbi:hypothetical protein HYDPIDRAFT_43522 [Hydnomerulius pinastri MD-312]|uniref:Unplaced genomic scaffold scaffold_42, whole genome shotgun sequence n=1 Tax=Hydnomerulius pinastri MD-312 TaxID=994086 RepID=A0A0C9VQV7_9AGAM|nr:hypothetical protein HYDPIDRAFT_43522 [Hydnomerulius pinastri MD-312]